HHGRTRTHQRARVPEGEAQGQEGGVTSAKSKTDVVVIGAGHNGLVAAAYLAKAGKRVVVLERSEHVGGILRGGELAPGFIAPGLVPTVGRLRASIVKDLKLDRHGFDPITPAVRIFAP